MIALAASSSEEPGAGGKIRAYIPQTEEKAKI
jgi:hypothetical protein